MPSFGAFFGNLLCFVVESVCSFARSFVHSFVHSFICSFAFFIRSFVYSLIRSFISSFALLFVRSLIRSFFRPAMADMWATPMCGRTNLRIYDDFMLTLRRFYDFTNLRLYDFTILRFFFTHVEPSDRWSLDLCGALWDLS